MPLVSLKFILETIRIAYGLPEAKLHIWARMSYPHGHEPDEELDIEGFKIIQSHLGQIVDQELAQAKIPFTFGSLTVPTGYFGK